MPGLSGILDPIADALDKWAERTTGGIYQAPERVDPDTSGGLNPLEWAKGLFSVNTGARIAAVLVGLILLGAAVWALVNASSKS